MFVFPRDTLHPATLISRLYSHLIERPCVCVRSIRITWLRCSYLDKESVRPDRFPKNRQSFDSDICIFHFTIYNRLFSLLR